MRFGTALPPICSSAAPTLESSRHLLGHDKLDTTARYTRVATGMIAGIKSPLDLLSQPHRKPGKKPDTGEKDQPPA